MPLPRILDFTAGRLRPWAPDDRAPLIVHANNPRIAQNLHDAFPHPYTAVNADEWLSQAATGPHSDGIYAIDVAGEAIGGITVRRLGDCERHSAEIGYWIGESFWGRGIVTAALSAITVASFASTDLLRLCAKVHCWNPSSMRVLEKAGYLREGILRRAVVKNGCAIDQILYATTREGPFPYVCFDAGVDTQAAKDVLRG